jgi:thiosulfate/3-mercaptopyruvate sulfurtransferase
VAEPVPPIVDAAWLAQRLGGHHAEHGNLVICDVRSTMSGSNPQADHLAEHLPGAVLVLLDDVLAAAPAGADGRHPLPAPADFAAALGALGIGDDDVVVAYDERGGAFASRLVWMLRTIGRRAALLDGGLAAWTGATVGGPTTRAAARTTPVDWPHDAVADADGVVAHVARGGVVVDSRDAARYAGEVEPIDAVAGHVPGAINLPFTHNLGPDGRFRPVAELADRFASAGVDGDAIVYCGSGVTACHNALAVEHAGLGRPIVYVGSWSGWSSDPQRPVATGDP